MDDFRDQASDSNLGVPDRCLENRITPDPISRDELASPCDARNELVSPGAKRDELASPGAKRDELTSPGATRDELTSPSAALVEGKLEIRLEEEEEVYDYKARDVDDDDQTQFVRKPSLSGGYEYKVEQDGCNVDDNSSSSEEEEVEAEAVVGTLTFSVAQDSTTTTTITASDSTLLHTNNPSVLVENGENNSTELESGHEQDEGINLKDDSSVSSSDDEELVEDEDDELKVGKVANKAGESDSSSSSSEDEGERAETHNKADHESTCAVDDVVDVAVTVGADHKDIEVFGTIIDAGDAASAFEVAVDAAPFEDDAAVVVGAAAPFETEATAVVGAAAPFETAAADVNAASASEGLEAFGLNAAETSTPVSGLISSAFESSENINEDNKDLVDTIVETELLTAQDNISEANAEYITAVSSSAEAVKADAEDIAAVENMSVDVPEVIEAGATFNLLEAADSSSVMGSEIYHLDSNPTADNIPNSGSLGESDSFLESGVSSAKTNGLCKTEVNLFFNVQETVNISLTNSMYLKQKAEK